VGANISGTLNYVLAKNSGTDSGTMSGTDSVYIYQGQTDGSWDGTSAEACAPSSRCANTWTMDSGWWTVKNASAITTGSNTTFPHGYADIADGSGVGISTGFTSFPRTTRSRWSSTAAAQMSESASFLR